MKLKIEDGWDWLTILTTAFYTAMGLWYFAGLMCKLVVVWADSI